MNIGGRGARLIIYRQNRDWRRAIIQNKMRRRGQSRGVARIILRAKIKIIAAGVESGRIIPNRGGANCFS